MYSEFRAQLSDKGGGGCRAFRTSIEALGGLIFFLQRVLAKKTEGGGSLAASLYPLMEEATDRDAVPEDETLLAGSEGEARWHRQRRRSRWPVAAVNPPWKSTATAAVVLLLAVRCCCWFCATSNRRRAGERESSRSREEGRPVTGVCGERRWWRPLRSPSKTRGKGEVVELERKKN